VLQCVAVCVECVAVRAEVECVAVRAGVECVAVCCSVCGVL